MSYIKFSLLWVLFASTQTYSMVQLPQSSQHNFASFSGLPPELKEYLLPFVVSGTFKDMTRGLYNLAALDKKHHVWVNDPERMVRILDGLPRICTVMDLYRRLKDKKKSLPVITSEKVYECRWIARVIPLVYENELQTAAFENNQPLLKELLQKKNISLYRTGMNPRSALECAVRGGHVPAVKKLLEAGVDCNADVPLLTIAFLIRANTDIIQLLYDAGVYLDHPETVPLLHSDLERSRGERLEFLLNFMARWHYQEFQSVSQDKESLKIRIQKNTDKLRKRLLAGGKVAE